MYRRFSRRSTRAEMAFLEICGSRTASQIGSARFSFMERPPRGVASNTFEALRQTVSSSARLPYRIRLRVLAPSASLTFGTAGGNDGHRLSNGPLPLVRRRGHRRESNPQRRWTRSRCFAQTPRTIRETVIGESLSNSRFRRTDATATRPTSFFRRDETKSSVA